jgi:diguanylate cyclase (GGDEF)-like protein
MRSLRHFVLLVALPLLLAAGGVIGLTVDLVTRLSSGANIEDHRRTAEVVNSALQATREEMAHAVADNANWDDAAIELYKPVIDHDYVNSTWGEATATGVIYDLVFAVDKDGKLLSGFIAGEPSATDPNAYLGGRLHALLAILPQNATESRAESAIVRTPLGLVAVAAGNLVPTSADAPLSGPGPRFLVLAKFLDVEFFTQLGSKFVVENLMFSPEQTAGFVALSNQFGDNLGTAIWRDRRPGDVTRDSVMPMATGMLVLLLAVMSAIAMLCWQQFRQIAGREMQAQYDATHDALTGLPNRSALVRSISQALQRKKIETAVLFIDLDGFKEVNDTYDHETGDRLIKAVAAGFKVLAGDDTFISRLGGDEFVIMLTGSDALERAKALADRVIAFLSAPFDLEGRLAVVGGSIGIASSEGGDIAAGELMRCADIAMYKAKSDGKNRYRVFAKEMDSARDVTAAIVSELRVILAENRIEVAYQPIIDATSLAITGVEALARWPASAERRIGPDVFIPIAEGSGLINRLGLAVLEKACRDAAAWPDLKLSVNVSPVQLRNPDFAAEVIATIDRTGLKRTCVELEVTEGTLINEIGRMQPVFDALHKAGITIALDDFGSGYSSIAYLRELTFDRIKIDRSLTSSMLTSEMARNVIQATGLIANGISASVTAEGVESGDELQLLRLAGCTEFQGYLFGKPQTAAAITASLGARAKVRADAA